MDKNIRQWEEYQYDTTQPLTTTDVYAFFGKGGTAEFISEKLSELSGQQVSIPNKYIRNIDLWNNIVKPFRDLPQEKQTILKDSLISFVSQKQEDKKNMTNEQKSEQMYNFYKNQYEIKTSTKLTKNDVYAFLFQYGANAKAKLLEKAQEVLGKEVKFQGVKGEDFDNFVIQPIINKGEEAVTQFKQQLVDLLPTQKILQEQSAAQQKEQQQQQQAQPKQQPEVKQYQEPFAINHLKHMDVNKGLSDKNIFALTLLEGGEKTLQAKENVLQKFLGLSLEETKQLNRDQMIEKVKEVKFGERTSDLGEFQFKEAIQRVFLISEAEKNLHNHNYADELSSLEYPENKLWELKHIDKMLTEIDFNYPLIISEKLEEIASQNRDVVSYINDNKEELTHLADFHAGADILDFKQELLNEINSSPDFEQEILATLEATNKNSMKIGR